MVYKIDFENRKIFENNVELPTNSIILGRFEGEAEGKDAILQENNSSNLYSLFFDNAGNYAKISYGDDGTVSIITSACTSVYYYIEKECIYFSNLMIDIEDLAAEINQIDLNSVYYYIASGNFPPLKFTFWRNVHKVSGEHHVTIFRDGQVKDKKWSFVRPDEKSNKRQEYESILHFEAEGLKKWLLTGMKKPYVLISGVDSFNSFLALKHVGINPVAIHINVHELQRCYVEEFIKEYADTKFIEIEERDFSRVTSRTILDSYKEAIMPFFKWSVDNPITAMIFEKEHSKGVEITGDLTGITMAIKAFNSTLNQHSFWGRHITGAIKRSYYCDWNLINANNKFGSEYSLYNFMTSMFLPTKNFDALVPFKTLKKASGLNSSETQAFINVVHEYINEYAISVKWDVSRVYDGNVGKLFRSYKRELYMPGVQIANEIRNHLYGIERVSLFSSSRASVFEDNYRLDFYNDIYNFKKCVFDYFDAYHSVNMITVAKKAFRAFQSEKKLSLKAFLSNLVLYPARLVPRTVKNNDMYQKLKKTFSFLRENTGRNEYHAGMVTICERGEFIKFSNYCNDKVLAQYFMKLEESIEKKDMMEYSSVEERYVALSVYMKERTQHRKNRK